MTTQVNWASLVGGDSVNYSSVGIGTSNDGSVYKLKVNGDIDYTGNLTKNGVAVSSGGGSSLWSSVGNNVYYSTGMVGIGTTDPKFPLHITSSDVFGDPLFQHGFLNSSSAGNGGNQNGNQFAVQAKFTGTVHATLYRATSDARIKKDVVEIDDGEALIKLRSLQPKKYKYVDQVTHGTTEVFGFIAQDVAAILPEAVALGKDVVPDVYMLVTPDMVNRLIPVGTNKARSGILRIFTLRGTREISVSKAGSNVVYFNEGEIAFDELKDNQIFVYGFEVEDFHSMKKDQLWAINFAATQELDRKLQALQTQVDQLTSLLQSKSVI